MKNYDPKVAHEYYLKNKERVRRQNAQWREKYPERMQASRDSWSLEHPIYGHEYRKKNKDRIAKVQKTYYLKNKKLILERAEKRYEKIKSNPKLLLEHNLKRRLRHAKNPKQRNIENRLRESSFRAKTKLTKQIWQQVLLKYDGKCIYCGTMDNITIEHKMPISRGGTNDFDNLAPACYSCNVRKMNFL